jgi:DNA sulfur modification protein DndE
MIHFSVSEASEKRLDTFKQKFNVPSYNIVARIALSYSLSKNRKFSPDNLKDSKGREFKDPIILGNDTLESKRNVYIALVCQYYSLSKTDSNLSKYIKFHIDDGLELIEKFFESNPNHSPFDFLIEVVDRGIESIEYADTDFTSVRNSAQDFQKNFNYHLLQILVGKDLEGNPITITPNDTSKYNNCHIAVAGNSGTGKTQFALELLAQISEKSDKRVNFIYLDFKGLKEGDQQKMETFFNLTDTTFINAPNTPFPINPLSFIDNVNETNRKLGIGRFTDILAHYAKAGANQIQFLKDAVRNVFAKQKGGKYPTLKNIYEEVVDLMDSQRNKVVGVLEGLADHNVFADESNANFLNKNYYFSLSGDLPNDIRFTSVFLVINYIYNVFMNMEDTPTENDAKSLRYVLLIDEAHTIFKDRKSQEILEKVLREIRSKGVSVVLLSQGIAEFNQPSFDFSSMCEITFLLDTKDKNNTKSINKFLGFSEAENKTVARSMERIQKGQAISNIKEFKKGELFEIKQFKDR